MTELWKDVSGYEGHYQVSNIGNIKSLNYAGRKNQKLLKLYKQRGGYLEVVLGFKGNHKHTLVHRIVIESFKGKSSLQVDHINGIKTDNRIENLRYCTNRENQTFKNEKLKFTSRFIGVHWEDSRKKWRSSIHINGKNVKLGRFDSELEASFAYQNKLKEINGHFLASLTE